MMLILIHNTLNCTSFLQTLAVYVFLYLPSFYLVTRTHEGIKFNAYTGEPVSENLEWNQYQMSQLT